jgi:hypothetical protein
VLALAVVSFAADAPANVVGTWTISLSSLSGKPTQTIVIKQDGNKITGTFKGPNQSGTVEGTVEGNNISFQSRPPDP